MKYSLQSIFIPWVSLVCSTSLCGQEPAAAANKPEVTDLSPDGRFAFATFRQSVPEPYRTCDLVENASGKVLLRVAQSDSGHERLGIEVLWSSDSRRFSLFTTYNHFGAELSIYVRTNVDFRQLVLPDISAPEIHGRFKRGHEWKWTGINSASARRWQKDGTLTVRTEGTLHAINSPLVLTSQRTVVLGISKSGKVVVLKSGQKVIAHDEGD